jgi:hypothetical protein
MKLFLLFFITISSLAFSQEYIGWNQQKKLSFDDFKGEIKVSTAAAVSSTIIKSDIVSQSVWTGRIKVRISAVFDKSTSWVKKEFMSARLLAHEQGHFDITEIFSRKLQIQVDSQIKGSKDYLHKFEKIYNDLYQEYFEFQTKYEVDTDKGRDAENQEKYNKLIHEMLQ